jgi:hypothetical protein
MGSSERFFLITILIAFFIFMILDESQFTNLQKRIKNLEIITEGLK